MSEAIVSIYPSEEEAKRFARKVAMAVSEEFVRCRVRQMNLTKGEIVSICFAWGREDALAGEPLGKLDFPQPYAAAYRRAYRAGKRLVQPGGD